MIKRKGYTRKHYSYPEVVFILDSLIGGKTPRAVGVLVNRTSCGVRTLYSNYKKFVKTGNLGYWIGKEIPVFFKKYQQGVAPVVEEKVETKVETKVEVGTLEEKVTKLNQAFNDLKKLIADVAEEAVKAGIEKETAGFKEELNELREFKEKAKMENLGDTLMKRLRGG